MVKIKNYVRNFLLFLLAVFFDTEPRGTDLLHDITAYLPGYKPGIIFDVGANIGQATKQYREWFPQAMVYCFEPVSATFQQLQANLRDQEKSYPFQLALSSAKGVGTIVIEGCSLMSFLVEPEKMPEAACVESLEEVEVETLDNFCRTNTITHIDFLKIDTEGGDLEVLRGAETLLKEQRIDLVEIEVGMNPGNTRHVPFEMVKAHLERKQYFLFGLYEQVHEWPTQAPHLRRANAVFLSGRLIRENTRGREPTLLPA